MLEAAVALPVGGWGRAGGLGGLRGSSGWVGLGAAGGGNGGGWGGGAGAVTDDMAGWLAGWLAGRLAGWVASPRMSEAGTVKTSAGKSEGWRGCTVAAARGDARAGAPRARAHCVVAGRERGRAPHLARCTTNDALRTLPASVTHSTSISAAASSATASAASPRCARGRWWRWCSRLGRVPGRACET